MELLIVIVIIAILAAITIVAYNGIQTRANNTQTVEAMKQFVKAYHMYALDNGGYPNATGCLGEGYPSNRCLAQSGASACFGMGAANSAPANAHLRPYMNNQVPSPSMQQIACGGTTYVGMYNWYDTTNGKVTLFMVLKGDQTCPPMSPNVEASSKSLSDEVTRCSYRLSGVT